VRLDETEKWGIIQEGTNNHVVKEMRTEKMLRTGIQKNRAAKAQSV
jgi:hypothetical protein